MQSSIWRPKSHTSAIRRLCSRHRQSPLSDRLLRPIPVEMSWIFARSRGGPDGLGSYNRQHPHFQPGRNRTTARQDVQSAGFVLDQHRNDIGPQRAQCTRGGRDMHVNLSVAVIASLAAHSGQGRVAMDDAGHAYDRRAQDQCIFLPSNGSLRTTRRSCGASCRRQSCEQPNRR